MDHFPDMCYHYLHKQQAYDECAALAVAHLSIYQGVCLKYTHTHITFPCSVFIEGRKYDIGHPEQTFMLINKDQHQRSLCFQRKFDWTTQLQQNQVCWLCWQSTSLIRWWTTTWSHIWKHPVTWWDFYHWIAEVILILYQNILCVKMQLFALCVQNTMLCHEGQWRRRLWANKQGFKQWSSECV